ncbi:hypothetical protein RB599_006187 [Gaeumannomyces hyphopodioides]
MLVIPAQPKHVSSSLRPSSLQPLDSATIISFPTSQVKEEIRVKLDTMWSLTPSTLPQEAATLGKWLAFGLLAVLALYIVDYAARWHRYRRLRSFGLPPPVIPFVAPLGLDLAVYSMYRFLRFTFFELINTWCDAVPGHTVELRMLGTSLLFTDEPANIKAIMSTEWSSFGRGEVTKRIWGDMLGDTQIFVVDGEDWHRSKDRIREHVTKLRPDDLSLTESHVQKLFGRFDQGKPVEVFDLIDRYQLDVVTDVFFGETADSLTSEPPFREPMNILHPINTARMLFGKNAYYVKDKYLAPKALRELNAYTTGVADRAFARDLSKKSPEDYNMLDDLASQKRSHKDPSAILITWAIFMMAKHPHIMRKMQAEVAQHCGTNIPTPADLRQLGYVRSVINETFRLYHPLGLNVRMALNDVALPVGGGKSGKEPLAVAKDTTIIYSLGGLQRRKDIYGDDALEFRPERWEDANISRWHFIPYNHGPRHCMGRVFGQQQMEYALARICQEYAEIRVPADQPEQQIRVELNLKMAHPCMCEFVKKAKSG